MKAMSHDTSAPSVNGQTLEGITSEANLSSMEQPESTTVLSVTTTSSYSTNGHIQGMPAHRPGHKHGNTGAMSRVPCKQCGRESHAESEESNPVIATVRPPQEVIPGLSQQDLREAQWAILTWLRS